MVCPTWVQVLGMPHTRVLAPMATFGRLSAVCAVLGRRPTAWPLPTGTTASRSSAREPVCAHTGNVDARLPKLPAAPKSPVLGLEYHH
jgi:hypothetical protein